MVDGGNEGGSEGHLERRKYCTALLEGEESRCSCCHSYICAWSSRKELVRARRKGEKERTESDREDERERK